MTCTVPLPDPDHGGAGMSAELLDGNDTLSGGPANDILHQD
ncbi:hypothetical protein [Streptomyces sp. MK37H]|nr:hypothetical protein [Streptomyces sp. MK37H]